MSRHRPGRKPLRSSMQRAAVALVLQVRQGELHILMIKRAEREGDPWSGHMAFPGGRREPGDRDGFEAAVRETEEEVGLSLRRSAAYVGRLSELDATPRRYQGVTVTPYVFRVDSEPAFRLNYEVAEVLWVPLEFLLDTDNREEMTLERDGQEQVMPCYYFQGCRIWGISLMMLDELLDLVEGRNPRRAPWRSP